MDTKYKYGALVAFRPLLDSDREIDLKNMGDFVQTIAGMQYLPHVDEYVTRDNISDFTPVDERQKVKVIMNAWWMWNYKKWPPADVIEPLPISMHISPLHSDDMLSGRGLQWFKRYEPIGCRDNGTLQRLQAKGIKCYYSGCLTLTLGRTYKPIPYEERDGVCFADPYFVMPNSKKQKIRALLHVLVAPLTIFKMSRNSFFSRKGYNNSFPFDHNRYLKTLIAASAFHRIYSSFFSNIVLRTSEYISHVKIIRKGKDNNYSLIQETDRMLKHYQSRKLVVTSRIHAALPCLAMETPVIFIENSNVESETWNANRLDGLTDLFRCMNIEGNRLETNDNILLELHHIGRNIPVFRNKNDWRPIADKLARTCCDFVKESN